METDSITTLGTDSIRSFASLSPKEVKLRTTLITVIRFAVGTSCIITSNSVFSSTSDSSTLTIELELITPEEIGVLLASTPKVSSFK